MRIRFVPLPIFVSAFLFTLFAIPEAHATRWYSPSTGRWLSRDPMGELGARKLIPQRPNVQHLQRMQRELNELRAIKQELTTTLALARQGDDDGQQTVLNTLAVVQSLERKLNAKLLGVDIPANEDSSNPYLFVDNQPISKFDPDGRQASTQSGGNQPQPSDESEGFKCNVSMATKIFCKCLPGFLGRTQLIAGVCTACRTNCYSWCVQKWLDDDMSDAWLNLCKLDCDGRIVVCVGSGCKLKFDP